jgi:hypothetical protein
VEVKGVEKASADPRVDDKSRASTTKVGAAPRGVVWNRFILHPTTENTRRVPKL